VWALTGLVLNALESGDLDEMVPLRSSAEQAVQALIDLGVSVAVIKLGD